MTRIAGIAAILLLVTGLAVEGTGPVRGEASLGGAIDEGPSDPAFAAFRARLLAAVRARDTEAVLALSSPDIRVSFGGEYGVDGFRTMLDPDPENLSPEYAIQVADLREDYWLSLEEVVAGGGAFTDGGQGFRAPWTEAWEMRLDEVAATDGLGEMDPYDRSWVAADEVPVYAAADSSSEVIDSLGRGRVRIVPDAINWIIDGVIVRRGWARITLPDGREGFIAPDGYRQATEFRAAFARDDAGAWTMTLFIAGD